MFTERMSRCEFANEDLILRLQLTISADVRAITPIVDCVMELAMQMGCAAGKEMEVETALREALANAIVHGCKNDTGQKFQFSVGLR